MPDYFGKGMGQKLMQDVFEKAAALGREAVWLTVMKSGPIQAYERAGFRIAGEEYWAYELLREEQRGGLVMVRTNNPK